MDFTVLAMSATKTRRVLIVLGTYFPANNAASVRISSLAQKLSERKHIACVVSSFLPGKDSWTSSTHRGANFSVLQTLPMIPFAHVLSNALNALCSFLFSLVVLVRSFDLVVLSVPPHESAIGFHLGVLLRQFLCRKKIPLVYDYRDDLLDESRYSGIYRGIYSTDKLILRFFLLILGILIERADALVCVVERHKHLMVKRGYDEKKIYVVHNGVDLQLFRPVNQNEKVSLKLRYGFSPHTFVMVAVSGAGWIQYRLEPIMMAMKLIRDSARGHANLLLLVIGKRTRELETCLKFAEQLGLDRKVIYLAQVVHNQMPDILNVADIGVVPLANYGYLKDTLPVKLFEYCACGLPVVATAPPHSLTESFIEKHSLGFVFEPKDVKGLAEAIKRLYKDEHLRRELGARGRIAIETEFDRDTSSERYASLLERLIDTYPKLSISE